MKKLLLFILSIFYSICVFAQAEVGQDGNIQPTGDHAVVKSQHLKGALQSVQTLIERNNIFQSRREVGMLVFVRDSMKYFQLATGTSDSDWVPFVVSGGGVGGGAPSGAAGGVLTGTYPNPSALAANSVGWTQLAQATRDSILDTKYVHLIVLGLESNSGGRVLISGNTTSADLEVKPQVQIWNNGNSTFQNLQIGVNNLINHNSLTNNSEFSFELELANQAIAKFKSPVYLVKVGHGGSTIAQWLPATTPFYYDTLITRVDKAIAAIRATGKEPLLTFWNTHGVNDAIAATDTATWRSAEQNFVANIRKRYGWIPFVYTKIMPRTAAYININSRIDALDAADDFLYTVPVPSSNDSLLSDGNHWNKIGMAAIATRLIQRSTDSIGTGLRYINKKSDVLNTRKYANDAIRDTIVSVASGFSSKYVTWENRTNSTDSGLGTLTLNGSLSAGAVGDTIDVTQSFLMQVRIDASDITNNNAIVSYLEDNTTAIFDWGGTPRQFVAGFHQFANVLYADLGNNTFATPISTGHNLVANELIRLIKSSNNVLLQTSLDSTTWTTRYTFTSVLAGKTTIYNKALFAVSGGIKRLQNAIVVTGFEGFINYNLQYLNFANSKVYRGAFNPEGILSAAQGSTLMREGGGVNTSLYIKETGTGATGWKAVSSSTGGATTYYMDVINGNDLNDGLSPEKAFKSITKLNTVATVDNMQISFRRGEKQIWRQTLNLTANPRNVTFNTYGEGRRPRFSGGEPQEIWSKTAGRNFIYQKSIAVEYLATSRLMMARQIDSFNIELLPFATSLAMLDTMATGFHYAGFNATGSLPASPLTVYIKTKKGVDPDDDPDVYEATVRLYGINFPMLGHAFVDLDPQFSLANDGNMVVGNTVFPNPQPVTLVNITSRYGGKHGIFVSPSIIPSLIINCRVTEWCDFGGLADNYQFVSFNNLPNDMSIIIDGLEVFTGHNDITDDDGGSYAHGDTSSFKAIYYKNSTTFNMNKGLIGAAKTLNYDNCANYNERGGTAVKHAWGETETNITNCFWNGRGGDDECFIGNKVFITNTTYNGYRYAINTHNLQKTGRSISMDHCSFYTTLGVWNAQSSGTRVIPDTIRMYNSITQSSNGIDFSVNRKEAYYGNKNIFLGSDNGNNLGFFNTSVANGQDSNSVYVPDTLIEFFYKDPVNHVISETARVLDRNGNLLIGVFPNGEKLHTSGDRHQHDTKNYKYFSFENYPLLKDSLNSIKIRKNIGKEIAVNFETNTGIQSTESISSEKDIKGNLSIQVGQTSEANNIIGTIPNNKAGLINLNKNGVFGVGDYGQLFSPNFFEIGKYSSGAFTPYFQFSNDYNFSHRDIFANGKTTTHALLFGYSASNSANTLKSFGDPQPGIIAIEGNIAPHGVGKHTYGLVPIFTDNGNPRNSSWNFGSYETDGTINVTLNIGKNYLRILPEKFYVGGSDPSTAKVIQYASTAPDTLNAIIGSSWTDNDDGYLYSLQIADNKKTWVKSSETIAYNVITSTTSPQSLSKGDNLINQGATQAAFTFTLPSVPVAGELVFVTGLNAVTNLTISSSKTIVGASNTLAAGAQIGYKYYGGAVDKWVKIK